MRANIKSKQYIEFYQNHDTPWVGLRVRVGGSSPCTKSNESRNNPSRERRRARSTDVRKEQVLEPAKKETANDYVTTEEVDEENLQVTETVKEEKEANDCGTTEEVVTENVKDDTLETARVLTAEEVVRKYEKEEQCDKTIDKIEKDISTEDDATG